jgi:hypothetical protein
MSQLYDLYKNQASPAQRAYIDSMVTSQSQVRNINPTFLHNLASIKDDSASSQVLAATILLQMNVTPVISILIPFGGDNHSDPGLATEATHCVSGVQTIVQLLQSLSAAGLQDKATFTNLNVFGRTLAFDSSGGTTSTNGRAHNGHHQVSVLIGKPFKGGVIGGVAPVQAIRDYGAMPINSTTGAGDMGGDIAAIDTLAAFGQTVVAGVGGDPSVIDQNTAKIVTRALA